jgi:EAL domain-containing protein (putative c-di-GMP-specific phosphodiesterase class I)
MAQLLGIQVVAEGLETPEQLKLLQSLKCDYAQGYLIREAMCEDQASVWLQAALEPVT